MKKHWLRGMLLGVSMALLLAGGVALAQGAAGADTDCVNCVPPSYWDVPWEEIPYGPYGLTVTGAGWPSDTLLAHYLRWPNNEVWQTMGVWTDGDGDFIYPEGIAFWCECPRNGPVKLDYEAGASALDEVVCPEVLGVMEFYYSHPPSEQEASVFVLLAEDCFAATFVPEPGTIMLLGSGLAGLAGYATLRLRRRP
jgi:hypothetical protein